EAIVGKDRKDIAIEPYRFGSIRSGAGAALSQNQETKRNGNWPHSHDSIFRMLVKGGQVVFLGQSYSIHGLLSKLQQASLALRAVKEKSTIFTRWTKRTCVPATPPVPVLRRPPRGLCSRCLQNNRCRTSASACRWDSM